LKIVTLKPAEQLKTADHQFSKIGRMKKAGGRKTPFIPLHIAAHYCQASTQLAYRYNSVLKVDVVVQRVM
jgi:hypothetical protein